MNDANLSFLCPLIFFFFNFEQNVIEVHVKHLIHDESVLVLVIARAMSWPELMMTTPLDEYETAGVNELTH